MNILHLTYLYPMKEGEQQKVHQASCTLDDYKLFWTICRSKMYKVLHIHTVEKEVFGLYAYIARLFGLKVVVTLHNPTVFSYWYLIKRLFTRYAVHHLICTSQYDMKIVDTYHISKRSKRSLVYQGGDILPVDISVFSKESARSYIYKRIGASFTKNIRIVGTIIHQKFIDESLGIEHLVDTAYLADTYKNLTNTIFVILSQGDTAAYIQTQIEEMGVTGICFVIDELETPEVYMKAFDVYISPRVRTGDIYMLIHALQTGIPCIATKVGDTYELEKYMSAPLVPVRSAKYITEALMYVIGKSKDVTSHIKNKPIVLPKKFTKDFENQVVRDVYEKVMGRG